MDCQAFLMTLFLDNTNQYVNSRLSLHPGKITPTPFSDLTTS